MTPAAILSISMSFHRGHELCYGNGLPADNGEKNAPIPAVVCLAFATELALKANLLAEKAPSEGHSLLELFEKLDTETRRAVRSKCGLKAEDFDVELGAVSKAFVEWRYIYETPGYHSINLPFLQSLWSVLAELAEGAVRPNRSFKADAAGGAA